MDPAMMSYLVWVVRLVLPILFFVVWHSLQPAKEKKEPQPTGHRHARLALLRLRKEVMGQDPPASISRIKLVEESLVNKGGPRGERGGRRDRGDRGDRTAESPTEKRERRERRAERKKAEGAGDISREDKLHLESLLNYVAFSRKHRPQAAFLPDSAKEPAPPEEEKEEDQTGPVEPSRTNAEAQMVLKGLTNDRLGLKCADLARDLHDRLVEAKVEVDEPTFILMIEACIRGGDLTGVSDFLQKMETSGFCPPSALLDKVMDLYAANKEAETADLGLAPAHSFGDAIKIGNNRSAAVMMGEADTSEGEFQQAGWGDGMAQEWVGMPQECLGSAFNFDAYSDED